MQDFLKPLVADLTLPQRTRLWMILLAWVLTGRAGRMVVWARAVAGRHRTSLAAFLNRSNWDSAKLLDAAVRRELKRMRPRPGEVIELLIDDTRIAKRAKKMAAISSLWDHAHGCFIRGHIVLACAVRFRGVVWPWRLDLWLPEAYTGKKDYVKLTEMAARMVREFPGFPGLNVRVLFDAFYLSPVVTQACQSRGWEWYSVAARNRKFTVAGKNGRQLGDWSKGYLQYHGRRVRMRRSRGWAKLTIAGCDGLLSKIGEVRVVVSKRPHDSWKNRVVFVTNAKHEARKIVEIYEHRWDIEVLFKELKGTLGLGSYQVLSRQGICHHLNLCGLTHVWLTRRSLDALDAKAKKNKEVPLPPLSRRLESLREELRKEQGERILCRVRLPNVRKKLRKVLSGLGLVHLAA